MPVGVSDGLGMLLGDVLVDELDEPSDDEPEGLESSELGPLEPLELELELGLEDGELELLGELELET